MILNPTIKGNAKNAVTDSQLKATGWDATVISHRSHCKHGVHGVHGTQWTAQPAVTQPSLVFTRLSRPSLGSAGRRPAAAAARLSAASAAAASVRTAATAAGGRAAAGRRSASARAKAVPAGWSEAWGCRCGWSVIGIFLHFAFVWLKLAICSCGQVEISILSCL
jgi:hypothetical protein